MRHAFFVLLYASLLKYFAFAKHFFRNAHRTTHIELSKTHRYRQPQGRRNVLILTRGIFGIGVSVA